MQSYTYDKNSGRYRDANGWVPKRKINAFKKRIQKRSIADTKAAFASYKAGEIDLAGLQQAVRDAIRRGTVAIAAVDSGGASTQNPVMLAAGRHLQLQYKYLSAVFKGYSENKVTDAQLLARITRYAADSLQGEGIAKHEKSPRFCYRTLGDCEHCRECLDYFALGIKTKDELPAPGIRCSCTSRCKCSIFYFESLEDAITSSASRGHGRT